MHKGFLYMSRARCPQNVTCFGVGGDEEVWGVRTESPDGVPAIGRELGERNPIDWNKREAIQGAPGLFNGLVKSHLFLVWHDWHCQKFTQTIKWFMGGQHGGPSAAASQLTLVLCPALTLDLLCCTVNSSCANLFLLDSKPHNLCLYVLATVSPPRELVMSWLSA